MAVKRTATQGADSVHQEVSQYNLTTFSVKNNYLTETFTSKMTGTRQMELSFPCYAVDNDNGGVLENRKCFNLIILFY